MMEPSILVVTGGRFYKDRRCLFDACDVLHAVRPVSILVHGACPFGGADILGEDWAKDREVPYLGMPARFKAEGKADGPARSYRMLKFAMSLASHLGQRPPRVAFFPGDVGTGHCIRFAREFELDLYDGVRIAATKHSGRQA